MSAEVGREVSRRTLVGMRWGLVVSAAVIPLSFLTNTLLARVSPLALGHYGAVMLFFAAFQAIAILGGPKVFTRFIPMLDRGDRVAFFFTYSALALGLFLVAAVALRAVAPGFATSLLARFGGPSFSVAVGVAVATLAVLFLNHFLFAVLAGRAAAALTRFPVVGFFVAALLGAGVLRGRLASDPSSFVWNAALATYAASAILAGVLTLRTEEFREPWRVRLLIPAGFWPALLFTHLESLVVFAYSGLAPTFVLLWLDVASLAPLHGALRFVSLFEALSALLSALLSPALAALDSQGLRDTAFRHATRAMNTAVVVVVPACLVLIFFAPDAMGIFGPQFRSSADLLRIVAVAAVASPIVQFGGGMLVAFGAYRVYLGVSTLSIAAAVALNVSLIPALGLTGAAWAATLGALAHACVVTFVLRIRLGFRIPARAYLATIVLGSAVAVALLAAPGRGAAALLVLLFGTAFLAAARVTWEEVSQGFRALAIGRSAKG